MPTIVSSQTEMKSMLDMKIVELKTLLERASQILTTTTSTSGTPRGGSTSQGRTCFIQILPTSVILLSRSSIEQIGFIEVDLAGILTKTLQMVQVQVQEELRERELITYQQNERLTKENDQLQARNESISTKQTQKEHEESKLKQVIKYLCAEIPQCNFQPETPLLQKVKRITASAKDLEGKIEKMDVEHKAHIVELEAKELRTPPEEHEARVAKLQGYATMIALHLAETQKLLDEATTTWTTMEDIDDLVEVCVALQKNQKELDEVMAKMKDLAHYSAC